jgi:hypothetical protein
MSTSELSDLTMDIVTNGLRNPITLFEGMVLDGWHRYRACSMIEDGEVRLHIVEFPPELDPVAFVRSQNYHRRHLTAGQKAVAEVELSKWAQSGENQHTRGGEPGAPPPETVTNQQMAEAAEVTPRTIQQAKRVVEAGLADAVKTGEVSVKRAAEVAKLPEPERQAALHTPRPRPEPRPRVLPDRGGSSEIDQLRRILVEREAQLEECRAQLQETAKLLRDTEEENTSFGRVIESDDQVAAAMAEAKRFRELARVVEERNRGLQGQNHALAKDARRWMNKFLRQEKLTKGEAAETGPEPSDDELGDLFAEEPLSA